MKFQNSGARYVYHLLDEKKADYQYNKSFTFYSSLLKQFNQARQFEYWRACCFTRSCRSAAPLPDTMRNFMETLATITCLDPKNLSISEKDRTLSYRKNLMVKFKKNGSPYHRMGICCASPGHPAGHVKGRLKPRTRLLQQSTCQCLTDLNKNITGLTDAQGKVVATWDYDAFGNIIQQTGTLAKRNPLRFSSEYHDEDLGLIYYNYRHYNPREGRWISRDLIDEEGGFNLYLFIRNSSLTNIDLLGNVAPGYEGANTVALYNDIQEKNRVPSSQGYNACDGYSSIEKTKCCNNERKFIDDPYPSQAKSMCNSFVSKYSVNGKVIPAVVCVAKCLVEKEKSVQKIKTCEERNAKRLMFHAECYAKCAFVLISSNTMGPPEGGWKLGVTELIPDFFFHLFKTYIYSR